MEKLFCPWRSNYSADTGHTKTEQTKQHECVFCEQFTANMDDKYFILKRTKHNIVMLNRYPYNAGHLMVLPIAHVARLHQMSKEARIEFTELYNAAASIVEKILQTDGINIGMNLGKAAGSGIPSHLHIHVLPRWHGDTNFLPLLAETKQISMDLTDVFFALKPAFDELDWIE